MIYATLVIAEYNITRNYCTHFFRYTMTVINGILSYIIHVHHYISHNINAHLKRPLSFFVDIIIILHHDIIYHYTITNHYYHLSFNIILYYFYHYIINRYPQTQCLSLSSLTHRWHRLWRIDLVAIHAFAGQIMGTSGLPSIIPVDVIL